MPRNEYTPEEALEVLLTKLRARAPEIVEEIQLAVDSGKDTWETEPQRGRASNAREFRKRRPFTPQEALEIATRALEAYFIEVPMFINSAAGDFESAAIGESRQRAFTYLPEPESVPLRDTDKTKAVEIEIQTETQLTRADRETVPVKAIPPELIAEEHRNLQRLRDLLDFAQ